MLAGIEAPVHKRGETVIVLARVSKHETDHPCTKAPVLSRFCQAPRLPSWQPVAGKVPQDGSDAPSSAGTVLDRHAAPPKSTCALRPAPCAAATGGSAGVRCAPARNKLANGASPWRMVMVPASGPSCLSIRVFGFLAAAAAAAAAGAAGAAAGAAAAALPVSFSGIRTLVLYPHPGGSRLGQERACLVAEGEGKAAGLTSLFRQGGNAGRSIVPAGQCPLSGCR